MAANKGFKARDDGTCRRCLKPIVADSHWIVLYNKPYPKATFHLDCEHPTVSPYAPTESVPEPIETDSPEETSTVTATPAVADVDVLARPSDVEKAIRDLINATAPKPATVDPASIRETVAAIAKEEVAKLVVPQTILVNVDNREFKVENVTPHKQFASLLYLMATRECPYLYGEPGWGKSQGCHEAAKALNLEFGYTALTLQTSDTRLAGFRDAHGNYHATPLRKLYGDGGVFLCDEMDRGNGNTLTFVNGMLANGHGSFPDGLIPRHPDFIFCASGNTAGIGANQNFPDCRPLDAATRDRFFFLEWEADNAFERTIGLGINPSAGYWIDWIQSVRSFVKANNLRLIVSPRATYKGALHLRMGQLPVDTLAEGVLFKGVARETVTRILAANPYPKA